MGNEMMVETWGLGKHFGGIKAVDDLTFRVEGGEAHCVIGPNGAGKSTFFKLLVGADRPSSGSIWFNGADITDWHPHERARAGMAVKFQDLHVFQDLTVEQNLFLPLSRHVSSRAMGQEIKQVLEEIGLDCTPQTPVSALSHGQRQWLAMGLCLASKPSLVLLDEPTAGMGPAETEATAGIVHKLREGGATVIVIEHDMDFVRGLNVRTTVLDRGTVFAQGSFAEIEASEEVRDIYLGRRRQ